jgi:hypothetical protein
MTNRITAWAWLACLCLTSSLAAQAPAPLGPGFQPPPGGPVPAVPGYIPPTSILNPSPRGLDSPALSNAFDEREREPNPTSVSLGFEYLFVWIQRPNFPPLVTTGDVNDTVPGAIGQKNTRVLLGGGDLAAVNGASAGRFTFSWVPAGYDWFGIDANYMIMEQRTQFSNIRSDATGRPLLARPFYNAATTMESSDLRSFPDTFSGTLNDSFTANLMGAEVNFRFSPMTTAEYGSSLSILIGPRWIQFSERYRTNDTITPIPNDVGTALTISDDIATMNRIFVGQVGGTAHFAWDRLSFDLVGKALLGTNNQQIRIAGRSTSTDIASGTVTVDNEQGLFAQTSNQGSYNRSRGIFGLETGLAMNVDITDHIGFRVGYTLLWLNHVIRPSDAIDRRVNIQPIGPSDGDTTPLSPGAPSFLDRSLWIQSIDLGINIRF